MFIRTGLEGGRPIKVRVMVMLMVRVRVRVRVVGARLEGGRRPLSCPRVGGRSKGRVACEGSGHGKGRSPLGMTLFLSVNLAVYRNPTQQRPPMRR